MPLVSPLACGRKFDPGPTSVQPRGRSRRCVALRGDCLTSCCSGPAFLGREPGGLTKKKDGNYIVPDSDAEPRANGGAMGEQEDRCQRRFRRLEVSALDLCFFSCDSGALFSFASHQNLGSVHGARLSADIGLAAVIAAAGALPCTATVLRHVVWALRFSGETREGCWAFNGGVRREQEY